jgi:hypothetical protein
MATNKELQDQVEALKADLQKKDEVLKIKDQEILKLKQTVEDKDKLIPVVKVTKVTVEANGTRRVDA